MVEQVERLSKQQIQDIRDNAEKIKKSLRYAMKCLNDYFYGKGAYGEETLGVDNLPAKPMSYRAMLKVHNMIDDVATVFEQMDSRVQKNLEEYESNPAVNIPRRSIIK